MSNSDASGPRSRAPHGAAGASPPSASIAIADVLREAKRLIEEKGWTQHQWACDARGKRLLHDDDLSDATCFCVLGAIVRVTGEPNKQWEDAAKLVARAVGEDWPANWNDDDGRTKEEVLAAFDRAIALADAPKE